jgi:acetyltransferase-like isoleucine patch superfamily enzyme
MIHETARLYRNVDTRGSSVGENSSIGDDTVLFNSVIAERVAINRRNLIHSSHIGSFTYTGVNTVVKRAQVGKFCSISWNVSIGGKDHDMTHVTTNSKWWFHKLDTGTSIQMNEYEESGDCIIGNDVWISANAIILRDVVVGHGAVIGAGAVVTKDVEPYSIVTGVPARFVRKRFSEEIIASLLDIARWDWPLDLLRQHVDLIYSEKVDSNVISRLRQVAPQI